MVLPTATSRPHVHPTACRTCRRRGRKCDKTLPTCQSCKDRSVVCEGYVTRWAGVAARGRLRGKSIPVLLDEDTGGKRSAEKGVAPARTAALARSSPEARAPRTRRRQSQDVPQSPPDSAALVVEQIIPESEVDGLGNTFRSRHPLAVNAFNGFDDDVLSALPVLGPPFLRPLSQINDSTHPPVVYDLSTIPYLGSNPEKSPYLLYVYPLTDRVLPLRYALAASAACHLASRFQNDALKAKGSEWHLKATELLRQRLQSRASSPVDLGTLMSILMMAQTDMCTGDCAEFDAHIPAAKAFVDEHGPTLPDRSYCEQRLAWLDIMRSTTSDRFLTFTSPDLKKVFSRYRAAPQAAREWGNEAFACPIDLLEYIVDVTVLYKLQPRGRLFSADALDKATRLLARVAAWTAPCEYYSDQMARVVSAWHAGIQLYVVRLFRLHQQRGGDPPIDTSALVEQALRPARALRRPPDAWSHASLWPLFQAALWLEGPDDHHQGDERRLVIHFLHTLLRASGCRQFQVAATTLDKVWKSGEYHDSITAGSFTGSLILG
ncbi:hypothetical protein PV04_04081 [Phialophora macrospora]|uniref:Zn(2)-C6 fungal-type domain-containing protein n=1 Tax=Phialophora macrospora TaxID=1851006 RepID=A0A0D2G882_9EURO|nr:hypothetical protein PV04_04081 [Phialophora macrospora]